MHHGFLYWFSTALIFWTVLYILIDWVSYRLRRRKNRQFQKGRELTKQDFIDFGFDEPIFLWPLKEDKDGHN